MIEGPFSRHLDIGRLQRDCLIAVDLGSLHAAIPHPMIHVATPEENQVGF